MSDSKGSLSALSVVDWNHQKRVQFEDGIETDSLVSEVVAEAVHRLELPRNVPYSAVVGGRKLNKSDSLAEAGLKTDDEIEVCPEVSAG